MRLLFILSFVSIHFQLFSAQQDSLLLHLELTLFPTNTDSIKITEVVGCEEQKIDSVYYIRAAQPDAEGVLSILEEIAFTKDTMFMRPLLEIYMKHIEYFKKEWEPIHRQNFYACDFADKQFQILTGFEVTLHSLYIGKLNLSPVEKYEYHKNQVDLHYKYLEESSNRRELIQEFTVFSPYYRAIKSKYWFAFGVDFGYLIPYLEEVENYFIQDFQNFTFDSLNLTPSYKAHEYFMLNNNMYFQQIKADTFEKVAMTKFNHWLSYNYPAWIYSIAGGQLRRKTLLNFLMEQLLTNPAMSTLSWDLKDYYMRMLFWNAGNKETVKQFLLNEVQNKNSTNRTDAIKFLMRFHEKEVLQQIKKLLIWGRLTTEEKKAAEQARDFLLQLEHLQ